MFVSKKLNNDFSRSWNVANRTSMCWTGGRIVVGRRIAPREARLITLSILRQAEDERRELAEKEARIDAIWEEQT